MLDNSIKRSLTRKLLRNDKELVALGGFPVEGLVYGEMLLLQGEDLVALDIGKGCIYR